MRETLEGWGRRRRTKNTGTNASNGRRGFKNVETKLAKIFASLNQHLTFGFPLDRNRKPRFFDSKHSAYFNKIYIYISQCIVLFRTGKYADKLKAAINPCIRELQGYTSGYFSFFKGVPFLFRLDFPLLCLCLRSRLFLELLNTLWLNPNGVLSCILVAVLRRREVGQRERECRIVSGNLFLRELFASQVFCVGVIYKVGVVRYILFSFSKFLSSFLSLHSN